MYENTKGFSLIGLIIKIIIIIIFILLAIWLVSKVINKTSNSNFEKNMNIMKTASIEYFKKGNLPEQEGEAKKVTLGDLIKMKYIASFDKKCDREKSYSQATLVDDYYALRVELVCGNKKDYIYTSINKDGNCVGDNCKNDEKNKTSKKSENTKTDDKNKKIENDSSAKNNTDKDNKGKTLYYEYVKVNRVYSDWTYNKLDTANVETKQETITMSKFCQILKSEYYLVSYYSIINGYGNYKIVVRLDNIPANTKYYNLTSSKLFNDDTALYENAIKSTPKTTFVVGNNGYNILNNTYFLKLASLKNSNATITSSRLYSNNGIYAEFDIRISNFDNTYRYNYNNTNKDYIYFIPVHYTINYADESSCIKDYSTNASKYNGYTPIENEKTTVTLYRSYTDKKDENDKKWSTEKTMDGYTQTGKTEYR